MIKKFKSYLMLFNIHQALRVSVSSFLNLSHPIQLAIFINHYNGEISALNSYQWFDIELFQVLLYGGQVVSWKNEQKEELLFMSSKVKNIYFYA